MSLLLPIFLKLLPLYLYVVGGYVAARYAKVDRESISRFVFYILFPTIIFTGVLRADLTLSTLAIPLISCVLAASVCGIFYLIGTLTYGATSTRNILAMSAGQANTGYFGLPVALILFDEATASLYVLGILGVSIYENSLGYYIGARGKHSVEESLRQVQRLPSLWAFIIAAILNGMGFTIPDFMNDLVTHARGAYSILGMMMIGMGFAAITKIKFDMRFTSLAFLAKFIVWPSLAALVIFIDQHSLRVLSAEIQHVLMLLSIVPMAANSVVIATLLKAHPEKVAFAVLLSTVVALVYVPLMALWLFF